MKNFLSDLRYSLRGLLKAPGFAAVAVLTLAVGIGANSAVFSVINAVLLRPLQYAEPDRLVNIWGTDARHAELHRALSYPDFADLRAENKSLEAASAFDEGTITLTGRGDPLHLSAGYSSATLLSILKISPQMGRGFLPTEDQPGARAVLMSHGLWQRQFNADSKIVGQGITLNGRNYTVVGVLPKGFAFPPGSDPKDVWFTMASYMETSDGDKPMSGQRGAHFLGGIARLKPGVTLAQANAEATAVADRLAKQFPDTNLHLSLSLEPALDSLVRDVRSTLLFLLAAVGLVILIACSNVANLILTRAASRQREIAIRTALGAGRGRILGQLFSESLLLALAGGAAGLLLAMWGADLLTSFRALDIPRLDQVSLDLRVLFFTFAISVLTAVLFGLAPAWHTLRFDLSESLKEGGRGAGDSAHRSRTRGFLAVSQITLAVVLLVNAGLLIRSLVQVTRVSPGFDPHGVLTFNLDLPGSRYAKSEQSAAFFRKLIPQLAAIPGARAASGVMPLPLSDDSIRTSFQIQGRPVPRSEEPRTYFRSIGFNYFQTMRIPLLSGRDFNDHDIRGAALVVLINETFAKKHFPNEDPIGKFIKPGVSDGGETPWRQIVGVVGDVRHRVLWQSPDPECYAPYDQLAFGGMYLVIRADGDPLRLLSAVRQQVKAIDPELPLYATRTMEDYISTSVAQRRFTTVLLSGFAGVALLLALIGLYGVISYGVAQRTREIGIRMALGAKTRDVLRLVLSQGARLVFVGIAVGLLGSWTVTRFLSGQLYGVTPTDPATFIGVSLLLGAVTLLATWIPARRASRVDPMVALRYE